MPWTPKTTKPTVNHTRNPSLSSCMVTDGSKNRGFDLFPYSRRNRPCDRMWLRGVPPVPDIVSSLSRIEQFWVCSSGKPSVAGDLFLEGRPASNMRHDFHGKDLRANTCSLLHLRRPHQTIECRATTSTPSGAPIHTPPRMQHSRKLLHDEKRTYTRLFSPWRQVFLDEGWRCWLQRVLAGAVVVLQCRQGVKTTLLLIMSCRKHTSGWWGGATRAECQSKNKSLSHTHTERGERAWYEIKHIRFTIYVRDVLQCWHKASTVLTENDHMFSLVQPLLSQVGMGHNVLSRTINVLSTLAVESLWPHHTIAPSF